MHINTPENSISDGPVTSILSMLHILIEILSCVQEKEGGGGGGVKICLNGLKFGT